VGPRWIGVRSYGLDIWQYPIYVVTGAVDFRSLGHRTAARVRVTNRLSFGEAERRTVRRVADPSGADQTLPRAAAHRNQGVAERKRRRLRRGIVLISALSLLAVVWFADSRVATAGKVDVAGPRTAHRSTRARSRHSAAPHHEDNQPNRSRHAVDC